MKERLKLYWLELWYYRIQGTDGQWEYEPNTRKLWATVSWIILMIWLPIGLSMAIYFLCDDKRMAAAPWGSLLGITTALITNAQGAIGWYTADKNSRRKNDQ